MKKVVLVAASLSYFLVSVAFSHAADDWNKFVEKSYIHIWKGRPELSLAITNQAKATGIPFRSYTASLLPKVTTKGISNVPIEISESDIRPGKATHLYFQAALGQFLEYLKSNKRSFLNNALLLTEHIKEALVVRQDYRYWALFFNAHKHLDDGNRAEFIKAVYSIWREVLIPMYQDRLSDFSTRNEFAINYKLHCINTLSLIIDQAIVGKRMSGLFPLGAVVENISQMFPTDQNPYLAVVENFNGRSTDASNLNFTVAFIKARNEYIAQLRAKRREEYEKLFRDALMYFDLAYHWADTNKGRAAVLKERAKAMTSVWIAKDSADPRTDTPYFDQIFLNKSQKTIDVCLDTYERLAAPAGQRQKIMHDNAFVPGTDQYTTTLKELWKANADLVEWQTINLCASGKYDNKQHAQTNHARQIVFANKYLAGHGYKDIVPSTAFYLLGNNAAGLADFSVDRLENFDSRESLVQAYNFQAYSIMLDPFNLDRLVQFSVFLSKNTYPSKLYRDYFVPLGKIISESIKHAATDDRYAIYSKELNYLGDTIPRLFPRLPQVTAYVRGETPDAYVRSAIILSNLFDALSSFSSERVAKEVKLFSKKRGVDNPKDVLKQVLSKDMYGKVSQSIGNGRQLNPYDFDKLYMELGEPAEIPLHLFLERLYYTTQNEIRKSPDRMVFNIDKYVVESASAMLRKQLR
ncbi:hypothetical protein [Maridesulfovibrio sp.]